MSPQSVRCSQRSGVLDSVPVGSLWPRTIRSNGAELREIGLESGEDIGWWPKDVKGGCRFSWEKGWRGGKSKKRISFKPTMKSKAIYSLVGSNNSGYTAFCHAIP